MRSAALSLSLALMAASLVAPLTAHAAAVYKWTDSQGVAHYDDQNAIVGKAMTHDYVEQRAVKNTPDWAGMVPPEFAKDVEHRCQLSRERLADYQNARKLYRRDDQGVVYRLTPAQAQQQIAGEVADLCGADAPRRLYKASLAPAKPIAAPH